MQIANPIYDVVFKYLMEDNKIAKLVLSSIIGEKIIALDFLPREHTLILKEKSFTVQKMDFSAKIATDDGGEKQVIIELQKAKFATDIMRFRRYLGEQYSLKENLRKLTKEDIEARKPLPIISIYFLGHKLNHIKIPFIKVKRAYWDGITGQELTEREEFIECLTHDSFIIQIPYLRKKHKTEVEQLLSIFNQDNTTQDKHILSIDSNGYRAKYAKVIRRLQQAILEQEVRDVMDLEDEILEELESLERSIELKEKKIQEKEKKIKEKENKIKEKEKKIQEKEKKIQENEKKKKKNDKKIKEKDKKIQEKDEKIQEKEQVINAKNKELEAQKKIISELMKNMPK